MDKNLEEIIRMSNEVGRDPELIQGGGGNTSVKTPDGKMYVKASGTALGDMAEGRGYRQVDVGCCIAILDDQQFVSMPPLERERVVTERLLECCVDEAPGRPSVEASLHALLGRCVIHTHPSLVNGLLCSRDGPALFEEIFSNLDPPPLSVGYCDFGYPLATTVREAIADYRKKHDCMPKVVFLQNHGQFVSAESPDEALELTRATFEAVRRAWLERMRGVNERRVPRCPREQEAQLAGEVCAVLRKRYREILGAPVLIRCSIADPVKTFLAHPQAEELAGADPLVPDEVVYCNSGPLWVGAPKDAEDVRKRVEQVVSAHADDAYIPACVLVDGLGLFTVATGPVLLDSALAAMEAVLQMLVVASCFGGARGMPAQAVKHIAESEVESYRHLLTAGGDDSKALAGQVAVVTGAGSGLGRGISLGLAKKGVHVVLADIDLDAARETARRIAEQGAAGSGWPAKVDVTSERSVTELFQYVTTQLGGVDILVNCAGIAPLYPLTEFPVKDWRATLEVNLTGYFLMAREATRVMKRQDMGGNIINLSSKSGLFASTNHSAYNATKAGEIHLARGWAIELAEHGIRVNAVCPGNVFKESKIWDEDYINALAKKRGIKPEEVIPYYIDLTALKLDVVWDDIADAVAFLVSPSASKITGQTLVVDAGQVFVR